MRDDGSVAVEVRGDFVVGDVAGGELDGSVVGGVEEVDAAVERVADAWRRREGVRCKDCECAAWRGEEFWSAAHANVLHLRRRADRCGSTSTSRCVRLEATPRTCAGSAHRQPLPIDLSTSKHLIQLPAPDKLAPVADILHTVFERDLRDEAVVERDEGPAAREGRMEVDVGPVGAGAVKEAWQG